MREWIKELYVFSLKERIPFDELRSYITNGSDPWIEWIESSHFPRGMDDFRYGDIERLIKHDLYYINKGWL